MNKSFKSGVVTFINVHNDVEQVFLTAEFEVVDQSIPNITIIKGKSVINDADKVVKLLYGAYGSKAETIFYFDNTGLMDELIHVKGEFKAFVRGPRPTIKCKNCSGIHYTSDDFPIDCPIGW